MSLYKFLRIGPFAILILFGLSSSFNARANGGVSGGGGNILAGSTPDEVVQAIREVFRTDLPNAIDELGYGGLTTGKRSTHIIAPLLAPECDERSKANLLCDLRRTRIELETKRACFDPSGGPRDSSEKDDIDGIKLCFSIPRLTKLDRTTLRAQILALFFHEYAHHYGFGENDAVYLQGHIYRWIFKTCVFEVSLQDGPNTEAAGHTLTIQNQMPYHGGYGPVKVIYEDKFKTPGAALRLAIEEKSADFGFHTNGDTTRLTFIYIDSDGSLRMGSVDWQHTREEDKDHLRSVDAPALNVSIGGRPLVATGVTISKTCYRRDAGD